MEPVKVAKRNVVKREVGGGGDLLLINDFKFCFQNFLLTKWKDDVYYQTMQMLHKVARF